MTTLSTLHPVKLNCQSVSDTQKLRHGDQITIADRTFRFEVVSKMLDNAIPVNVSRCHAYSNLYCKFETSYFINIYLMFLTEFANMLVKLISK